MIRLYDIPNNSFESEESESESSSEDDDSESGAEDEEEEGAVHREDDEERELGRKTFRPFSSFVKRVTVMPL